MDLSKYQTIALFNTPKASELDPSLGPMNPIGWKYIKSKAPVRAIFKGNQGGGTAEHAHDVALRCLGIHPVPERNRLPKPIRMVSKVVPEGDTDEQNQQYVELKRFLKPTGLLIKDITARNKLMTIRSPNGGNSPGGVHGLDPGAGCLHVRPEVRLLPGRGDREDEVR